MQPVNVRQMLVEDAGTVAVLMTDVISHLPYYNERAREEELAKYTPDKLIAEVASDPDAVLVALQEQRTVGFCVSRYDDGLIWLSWFGVEHGYRHRGVGQAMLAALTGTLSRRHAHKVWCDTRTDNLGGQHTLAQFGFRKLVELTNHWYGQDFILWEWHE